MSRKPSNKRLVVVKIQSRNGNDPALLLEMLQTALQTADPKSLADETRVEIDLHHAVPNEVEETELNQHVGRLLEDVANAGGNDSPAEVPVGTSLKRQMDDVASQKSTVREVVQKLGTEVGIKLAVEFVKSMIFGG